MVSLAVKNFCTLWYGDAADQRRTNCGALDLHIYNGGPGYMEIYRGSATETSPQTATNAGATPS